MRLALLSYSHHGRGMATTAAALGHEIAGVMDAEAAPRQQLHEAFGAPAWDDAGACLDGCRPDAALVAGRHTEMPAHVAACVERRIPFLLDKPFADCAARLRPVAEACARAGVPHGLTLPNRTSRLSELVRAARADGRFGEPVMYESRLNNGPPSRYDPTPSAWHNDAAVSGGGCWATEAAHGIDSFLQFAGQGPVEAVGAVLSNRMHGRPVEDVAVGLLRTAEGVTGIVESGYCYPASAARGGDHHVRCVWTAATLIGRYDRNGQHVIEVHTTDGVRLQGDTSHRERFRAVVDGGLRALREGRSYEADLADAVRILQVQDAVYARARAQALTNGPHPMGRPPAPPT